MNSQFGELLIAYGVSAASMLVGLLIMGAGRRAFLRWPVYSAMSMGLVVVLWSMLRKHVVPQEWTFTHARALYVTALALYSVISLSLGLLLGRLTGRKTSPVDAKDPP